MARILVVDDDKMVRVALRRILGGQGHEISTVDDGLHVLNAVRGFEPDLIIMDVLMPGLDGMAAVHHLKFDIRFRKIPVLMLTALNDGQTRKYSRESAVDCFMAKPIKKEILLDKIEELLKRKKVRVGREEKSTVNKKLHKPVPHPAYIVGLCSLLVAFSICYAANPVELLAISAAKPTINLSEWADFIFIATAPLGLLLFVYHASLISRLFSSARVAPSNDSKTS